MDSYNFHIPDFVRHFKLNILLADMVERSPEVFREGVRIASVYGAFPNMLWNGGRYIHGKMDPRVLQGMIEQFNKRGIALRFTLTNPMLTKEHLSDPFCNAVLKAANNGLNEAIVFSPLLEEHLRENFPGMKLTSSTCKQIEDVEELKAELMKDYSLVVLDYNFNNRFDVIEQLPNREKIELLIDPCCDPHCKRRGEHYRSIGRSHIKLNRSLKQKGELIDAEPFECPCMLKNLYQTTSSPLHITPEAVYGRYTELGVRNFKIEGRSVPDINVLENYIYYMVRPEHKDEVRLELLLRLTKNIKYF
ncbi:MAG: hypothetical protein IKR73_01470 [Oscillospiraceae bacterium]|nr:hypothetical protein [Oscillospiraceae bacterium]